MSRIDRLMQMPPSRRRQAVGHYAAKWRTSVFYRPRMRGCGNGTIIGKPLFWTPEFISVGSGVLIWEGCRIEGIDSYGDRRLQPHIEIQDGVSMQQHCHVVAGGHLQIGQGTTISFGVMITDVEHGYADVGTNVMEQALRLEGTRIGRTCFIGAGAVILAGTELGDHCIVGANSVVRGRFEAGSVIGGVPARLIRTIQPT